MHSPPLAVPLPLQTQRPAAPAHARPHAEPRAGPPACRRERGRCKGARVRSLEVLLCNMRPLGSLARLPLAPTSQRTRVPPSASHALPQLPAAAPSPRPPSRTASCACSGWQQAGAYPGRRAHARMRARAGGVSPLPAAYPELLRSHEKKGRRLPRSATAGARCAHIPRGRPAAHGARRNPAPAPALAPPPLFACLHAADMRRCRPPCVHAPCWNTPPTEGIRTPHTTYTRIPSARSGFAASARATASCRRRAEALPAPAPHTHTLFLLAKLLCCCTCCGGRLAAPLCCIPPPQLWRSPVVPAVAAAPPSPNSRHALRRARRARHMQAPPAAAARVCARRASGAPF